MKDLIILLCVLASVSIVPALGRLSARSKAARDEKSENEPAVIPPQPGTSYRA